MTCLGWCEKNDENADYMNNSDVGKEWSLKRHLWLHILYYQTFVYHHHGRIFLNDAYDALIWHVRKQMTNGLPKKRICFILEPEHVHTD